MISRWMLFARPADQSAGGRAPGEQRRAVVRLRPGRGTALLDQMVQGRPGVLQLRSQRGAADQSVPGAGRLRRRELLLFDFARAHAPPKI
jgi:hypothetical protein